MVRNEAKDIRDPEVAREYFRFAKRLETAMCIDAVLKLARALRGIDADGETFDAPPWLLNCPNGTVDLSTGRLRLHRREDFLTKLCPTPYKPGTPCPRWQQFLREVFDGDDDLISYVQWLSGYSLTGSTEHQVFAILYGSGANGKSTFIGALHRALGSDYATNLDPETLLAQHTPRHSTDLAALHGARLATAHETADGRRLNESLIKQLTGGDRIRARFVCQDSFEFSPQLKLWLCTNHRPTIRDDTHGMWRRVRLISFRVQFDGTKCDPSLARSLAEEASGILAWAVEGAKRCAAYGEPALPSAVRAATENYRAELDTLAEFLDTETEMWEHASVRKNALYQAYSNSLNGRCENQRAFAERMRAKGFCEGRDKDGRLIWRGLRLRILAPEDADRS
jgi:putative DNA primase/helicase